VGLSSFRIELTRNGLREYLASSEVEAMLARKARAVAQAAEARGIKVEGEPGIPVPIEVASRSGGSRARASVYIAHPAGLAVEAKHRLLGGSLDAARNA
jgi:hypothetical protein